MIKRQEYQISRLSANRKGLCFLGWWGILALLTGCGQGDSEEERLRRLNQKGEYIYRRQEERQYSISPPTLRSRDEVMGDPSLRGQFAMITKEHFRCKGCNGNPVRTEKNAKEETVRYVDCEGGVKHSLPIVNGHEYVAPLLLELLNEVAVKTGKSIVITCGHRCPIHNLYADSSGDNRASKHQIGAEVDFYVRGMEERPDDVVQIILDHYRKNPKYASDPALKEFQRYTKADNKLSTQPWYNKEIFVKLCRKTEARDFDNRHQYPYICIQLRFDPTLNQKVSFSYEKAERGYLRW